MRYSRRISNYPERIALSNPTHMMSIADPIVISVETLRRDTKDILWMDDCVLIISYESLATGYLKRHIMHMT